MKKQPAYPLLFICFVALIATFSCSSKPEKPSKPMVAYALDMAATELKKDCPKMINEEVRLDNVSALPNNVLKYNYTMVNHAIEDVDTAAFRITVVPKMMEDLKSDTAIQALREEGVTVEYEFTDKNGKPLTDISLGPDKDKK
jgi:hypothetical protein